MAGVVAAVGSVVAATAGTASAIHANSAAIKSRQQQRSAQSQAANTAADAQRKSDEAFAAANRRTPDVGSLLTAEQQDRLRGPTTALLTGAGGIDKKKLTLGGTSLLGLLGGS